MTWEEYFDLIGRLWEQVDKTDRDSIHEFNELKRELRHEVEREHERMIKDERRSGDGA